MSSSLKYRSDIDGLRAVAIIPVVLFHLGAGFPGGFIGVDVFFVISGFLITGIILKELDENRFTIRNFYARRVRRILPALAFMLVGVLALAWWLLLPFELDQLGKYLTTVSVFLANFTLYHGSGYWAPRSESLPLLHMWSLAVEEQFYIVIPLLLIVMHRWMKTRLIHLLGLLFVLSLVACIYITTVDPKFAFYMLPTRSWELLAGALIYCLVTNGVVKASFPLKTFAGILGLAIIAAGCMLLSNETAFPGYAALIPVVGAALVILANSSGQTVSGAILSWAPLRFIGWISYPLYLWHWPLIVFYKTYIYPHELTAIDRAGIFILSLLLATISWKLIETPFRRMRPNISSFRVIGVGATALVLFLGTSFIFRYTDGLPDRFAYRFDGEVLNLILSDLPDHADDRFQARKYFYNGGLQFQTDDMNQPKVVVIGDSHGAMFAPVVEEMAKSRQIPISFYTQDGVKPIFNKDIRLTQKIKSDLKQWKPAAIILIIRWETLWSGRYDTETRKNIRMKLEMLSGLASQLYVVLDVPRLSEANDRAARILFPMIRDANWKIPDLPYKYGKDDYEKTLDFLNTSGIDNLQTLDPTSYFVLGKYLNFHQNGRLFYRDDDHLNMFGAEHARPMFEEIFLAIKPAA